jgi:hypothetical protein
MRPETDGDGFGRGFLCRGFGAVRDFTGIFMMTSDPDVTAAVRLVGPGPMRGNSSRRRKHDIDSRASPANPGKTNECRHLEIVSQWAACSPGTTMM